MSNEQPKTPIDWGSPYSDSTGVARHVGSPNAHYVSVAEPNDFGIMVARDTFKPHQFQRLQSVGMHELGHALSIGWRDDTEPPFDEKAPDIPPGAHEVASKLAEIAPKSYEVYSGNQRRPDLAGGTDPTLENISLKNHDPRWSIMMAGTADDSAKFTNTSAEFPILLFSIEELSTADFKHIPSKEE